MTAHRWLTPEDEDKALAALRAWFREHPEVTDPEVAVKALRLPDMTGVPASPEKRGRTQRRMHRDATTILQHAGYAMRHEAAIRDRDGEPS